MNRFLALALALVPLGVACSGSGCQGISCAQPMSRATVFAASSLQAPFDEIAKQLRLSAIDELNVLECRMQKTEPTP